MLDDIGDLCKRDFKDPQVVLVGHVRVRAAGCEALGDHSSTFPPGDALSVSSCLYWVSTGDLNSFVLLWLDTA
jgi:hypothetical protein